MEQQERACQVRAALASYTHALSLDRYDKDSQALVQKLESQ